MLIGASRRKRLDSWPSYSQRQGVDFKETFSLVARFETVSLFLTTAAEFQMPIFQIVVNFAFLNGDLKEEVYVTQPEVFVSHENEVKAF